MARRGDRIWWLDFMHRSQLRVVLVIGAMVAAVVSGPPLAHGGVGWYLLQPGPTVELRTDGSVSLGDWAQVGAFDSARACEQERAARLKRAKRGDDEGRGSNEWVTRVELSLCVASDDVRLKSRQGQR